MNRISESLYCYEINSVTRSCLYQIKTRIRTRSSCLFFSIWIRLTRLIGRACIKTRIRTRQFLFIFLFFSIWIIKVKYVSNLDVYMCASYRGFRCCLCFWNCSDGVVIPVFFYLKFLLSTCLSSWNLRGRVAEVTQMCKPDL